jgi:hypothetical protein
MNNMRASLMVAMISGLMVGMESGFPKHMRHSVRTAPRPAKRYPQMVTSSRDEIAAHNQACNTRQVRRAIARKARKGYFAEA